MSSDTERAIEEILNDFERQPLQDKRTFRAYLNQPELISLSSTNAQIQSPPISPLTFAQYYNFTINLPRPALDAKSLQLLKAVIPQAQCSIPDYSLVFPYYKLRSVPIDDVGQIAYVDKPTYENLYFIRLLPSYYKPELMTIDDTGLYGYNKTFNDYQELELELVKACENDLSFSYNTHYLEDETTFFYNREFNKFIFRGLYTNRPPVFNEYGEWDATFTYNFSEVVFFNLKFYQSKIDDNIGNLPPGNTDYWIDITRLINGYTTWILDNPNTYFVNNVVQYANVFYRCIKDTLLNDENPPPTNPEYWEDVSQYFELNPNFNAYLIAGYDDPNVKALLQFIEAFSTEYDSLKYASIPGNKYVNGQTLARRLGFTWDGAGLIVDTINDYYQNGINFAGTAALFYNRIRPVPFYAPSETPPSLLRDSVIGSPDTYTADGYCNLVYSSIISIYTTIVGTSTVDTQRNANLLAMIPMDCGNLGVAMVGNYIDNALTKIQGDLYSIYIELRDENGEPYYLTNNATTTLLIKLTY